MAVLKIKEICNAHGISQKTLAERIGVSVTSLSRIATGAQNPSIETLNKIAATLDVSIADLFGAPNETVITCPHCGRPITIHADK